MRRLDSHNLDKNGAIPSDEYRNLTLLDGR
jgi:hypothetical protein